MNDYLSIKTSHEVWAVIRAAHPELVVFASFSDPSGYICGGGSRATMETAYGFKNADFPIIRAVTTWELDPAKPHERVNEAHQFWLCVGEKGGV